MCTGHARTGNYQVGSIEETSVEEPVFQDSDLAAGLLLFLDLVGRDASPCLTKEAARLLGCFAARVSPNQQMPTPPLPPPRPMGEPWPK